VHYIKDPVIGDLFVSFHHSQTFITASYARDDRWEVWLFFYTAIL